MTKFEKFCKDLHKNGIPPEAEIKLIYDGTPDGNLSDVIIKHSWFTVKALNYLSSFMLSGQGAIARDNIIVIAI
jgi:hypothetical protein